MEKLNQYATWYLKQYATWYLKWAATTVHVVAQSRGVSLTDSQTRLAVADYLERQASRLPPAPVAPNWASSYDDWLWAKSDYANRMAAADAAMNAEEVLPSPGIWKGYHRDGEAEDAAEAIAAATR